jgi:threonine dehydratase
MHLQEVPSKSEIIAAHQRIRNFVHFTPVLTSQKLNKLFGVKMFFKAENLQKGGSFKIRGATNAILLNKESLKNGVATHSSGNHAQALALAAKNQGLTAHIVMPENAPKVKVQAVEGYGAHITFCQPTLEARETTLKNIVNKTGATFIPPYNSYDIIAGQATMMKELVEEIDKLDAAFIPIGGGGLISGSILSTKYFSPNTTVIGAEPEQADDAYQSLKAGSFIPSKNPDTIADGLKTSLGDLTYPIIMKGVNDIITVSEQEIVDAMKLIFTYLKQVIEPSAAVPLAALIKEKANFQKKKVGLVLCGGNVDLEKLPF